MNSSPANMAAFLLKIGIPPIAAGGFSNAGQP